jgi:hypothetical protein
MEENEELIQDPSVSDAASASEKCFGSLGTLKNKNKKGERNAR